MVSNLFDKYLYPLFDENWDDLLFRQKILPFIDENTILLDVGAGAGIIPSMNFRGIAKKVIGIDLDPRVKNNEHLDESHIADATQIPIPDESCDMVISDNVFEHLENPDLVFKEVYRVLAPGGKFLLKTPNKNHYVTRIAHKTPLWFHRYYNAWRGRQYIDTFPTIYRANTEKDLQGFADSCGFSRSSVDLIEGRPEYLRKFAPFYFFGVFYERVVNSFDAFSSARILIIGFFEK